MSFKDLSAFIELFQEKCDLCQAETFTHISAEHYERMTSFCSYTSGNWTDVCDACASAIYDQGEDADLWSFEGEEHSGDDEDSALLLMEG